MIIEIKDIAGIEYALEGIRYAWSSTAKTYSPCTLRLPNDKFITINGEDIALANKLIVKPNNSEKKFLRQIQCWMEITAPRYWWTEFVTYRFGVEIQSESTMHTLVKQPLTLDNFEKITEGLETIIPILNTYIEKKDWYTVKKLLPESFLQKRMVLCSYQALRTMYWDRKYHPLNEWKQFCLEIEKLPLSTFLITPIS